MKRKLRMFKNEEQKEKAALLAANLLLETEGKINIKDLKSVIKGIDISKNYEIIVYHEAKYFNKHMMLSSILHEHSWAGEDGVIEKAEVLYGPNIVFGKYIDKYYSDNGNITYSTNEQINAEFDINSNHIVYTKTNSWSKWRNEEHYDDYEYKLICYLPKDHPYKLNRKAEQFIKMFGGI
jgi:hypothetical protein